MSASAGGSGGAGRSARELGVGLLHELQPLCRSITGNGVRDSLRRVGEYLAARDVGPALNVVEVPTGTQTLDWEVPREWNIRDAYIADASGRRLVDFQASALHIVSYSAPVDSVMSFEELRPHLHTMEDRPAWIPYRTSYHNETWGFCLRHDDLARLEAAGPLTVRIDSSFSKGSLTYGELFVPGTEQRELLVSTHICHPAMVNDNVTGIVAAAEIAARFDERRRRGETLRHGVRILFLPGTVGSIAWLSTHGDTVRTVDGGLVLTGLGNDESLTYKCSRRATTLFDRTVTSYLTQRHDDLRRLPWDPYGYDERQFCSPAFDLAVGRLTRGVHGKYPEYHTSADDLGFVSVDRVLEAVDAVVGAISAFDELEVPRVVSGRGEPQLGRRGLYRQVGGAVDSKSVEMAYLWVLSLADGEHSIADMCVAAGTDEAVLRAALERLRDANLVGI